MKPQCRLQLDAARASQGRAPLTDAQAAQIEARIKGAATALRNRDLQAWQAMTADDRTLAAARMAMQDIAGEAARKIRNAQLQVLKTAEVEVRAGEAAQRDMTRGQFWADEIQKASDEGHALAKEYIGQMMDAIEAAGSRQGATLGRKALMILFDADNPAMTRDIAMEIHARGKAGTGNQDAVKAAAEFEKVNEAVRQRFNAAGGDVGRLDYGYMPNAWDGERVLSAGYDRFAQDVLGEVDRSKYTREDGTRMTDDEVMAFLRAAGETIATNGANTAEPGAFKGAGATANRGAEHRQIHWKDGEAYVRAMSKYGSGGMYDALVGHVEMMARDIALIERFGPNPQSQHRLQRDMAAKANASGKVPLVAFSDLDHHWHAVAGGGSAQWEFTPPVIGSALEAVTMGKVSGRFTGAGAARFWQHARNVEVFAKLGSATLSAISDAPLYFATVGFNKLDYLQAIQNSARSLTPVARRELVQFMDSQGLIADTLIDGFNRMSVDHVSANWSGRLSQSTMRLSLMNYWTDSWRRAFSLTMQQGMGRWMGKGWGELDQWTREVLLQSRGITEADWAVMQSASLMPTKWGDILTPQAIYATGHPDAAGVVKRYMSLLSHESTMAIVEPDVAARAFIRRGTQPGTVAGEVLRLVGQFQAFPVAMFTRHWRRILDTPQGLEGAPMGFQGSTPVNRMALIGGLVAMMGVAGAISLQAKHLRDGKDPVNMDPIEDKGVKFWTQAVLQGGGFGFLGSLLLNPPEERGSRGWEGTIGAAGPVFGSIGAAIDLTQGNLMEMAQGKDTHAGAEAIRFVKGHAPLVNLFYAKSAIDHAVLHSLQEWASPGYLSRIQQRARKEWGQDYFLPPGASFDDMRAPDFAAAFGN